MLSEGEKLSLQRKFNTGMKDEVTIVVFADDTVLSSDLVETAKGLASLDPRIKVEMEKIVDGKNQRLRDMRIENYPVLILTKGDFNRIRYYGLPGGFEISPLSDAIVELSASKVGLSQKAKETLATVRRKANIKIFILTTCIYCPVVARHAYRAAIESPESPRRSSTRNSSLHSLRGTR